MIFRSKQSNGYDDAFMAACRDELTVSPANLQSKLWWVAVDPTSRAPRGCVCLIPNETTSIAEVSDFFIDPMYQRQGIGKQLWQTVKAYGHDANLIEFTLAADPNAVAFYQAMGFSVTGQTPSGSIAGRMLPLMTVQL
jgi:GNAT superfamily N-acetyltransferase